MENTQTNDQHNSIEIKSFTYEELDERYQMAIDMRIDGYRLKAIAQYLKVKEQTVGTWFMHDGICANAYEKRRALVMVERKKLFEDIRDQIEDGAVDAVVTLKRRVRQGNVMAAIDLLNRAGFDVTQKIEAEVNTKNAEQVRESVDDIAAYVRQNLTPSNQKDS